MKRLYKGDCINVLSNIETDSIDLVFTSPPYNMNLRVRNGKYISRQITKELTTKYKGFTDNKPMDEYFEFNKKVINELLRVSNLVFFNVQILTGNKPAIFKLMGEFHDQIKEIIVWDKINAQPSIAKNVMNSQFEIILVLQKSKPFNRSFESAQFDRGTLSNLWKIPRGKKVCKDHGAVFPSELAEKVILNFSKKGDTILDPFMGTGTTGEVSLTHNRNFVGIEMLDSYFNFSKERLKEL